MKSFKIYLSEDIMGGYAPNEPTSLKKTNPIKTLDQLVTKVGNNYSPLPNTKIVKLNDDFHIAIDKSTAQDDEMNHMSVRVFSSKPGHENSSLMHYSLVGERERVTHPNGKAIQVYSGIPQKTYTNVKRGVFNIPKNFIHTIANATGVAILSGTMQSPGGISMWRKAVQHGHKTNQHVLRVSSLGDTESYPGERYVTNIKPSYYYFKNYGKVTPRNFSDAYTLDVSAKRTGNKSKVPSGSILSYSKFLEKDPDNKLEKSLGNRALSRLLVLPQTEG